MNSSFREMSVALDMIRKATSGDVESQALALLLHVLVRDPDPLLVKDLTRMVGVSHGSIIRNLRLLGSDDDHPRGGKCAGLISCTIDPNDKRRKLVMLSAAGRRLRRDILTEIGR